MSESNKSFIVKDRRHFTPEGHVRGEPDAPVEPVEESAGEARSAPPVTEESPGQPAPAAKPEPERDPSPASAPAEARRESHPAAPESNGPSEQDAGPADFGQFLFSLGAQAGMLLSGQGLPEGADAGEAMAGARSIISILEMLKEKTEGRRTAQEDEILEGLLYELRMAYVEKSRAGGS